MTETAFIGDVHGELLAIRAILRALSAHGVHKIVLLGDYINKGPSGAQVVDELIALSREGHVACLRGNHETALLDCIESRDVRPFLRMSGAPTIRSYLGRDVGPDVASELLAAIPASHETFLRGLPLTHETDEYVASHTPTTAPGKFVISAHVDVGRYPQITNSSAAIDTGCGNPGGVLTALLWPSLGYIQTDRSGTLLARPSERHPEDRPAEG